MAKDLLTYSKYGVDKIDATIKQIQTELNLRIYRGVNNASNKISKMLKEEVIISAKKNVYKKHTPKYYKRRLRKGGLIDTKNMNVHTKTTINHGDFKADILKINDNHDLSVNNIYIDSIYILKNTTLPKNKNFETYFLADGIENGYGNKNTNYSKPRPFMKPVENDKNVKNKIRKILIKNIIDTLNTSTNNGNRDYNSIEADFSKIEGSEDYDGTD